MGGLENNRSHLYFIINDGKKMDFFLPTRQLPGLGGLENTRFHLYFITDNCKKRFFSVFYSYDNLKKHDFPFPQENFVSVAGKKRVFSL